MKKFLLLAVVSIFSGSAFAQQNTTTTSPSTTNVEQFSGERFNAYKQQMISNLNTQKAAIDQTISCANAAQNGQDLKKCREIKEQSFKQIQQNNVEQRKTEIQNQINKLEAKKQELGNKPIGNNVK